MLEFQDLKKNISDFQKVKLALLGDSATQLIATVIKGMGIEYMLNIELYEADFDQIDRQIFDKSAVTLEMLKKHHKSMPADPLLARPMYLFGTIEQVGTGTEMIVEKCIEKGLKKPEFIQEVDFSAILYRPNVENEKQVSTQVKKLLQVFNENANTSHNLMQLLNLRERGTFFRNYIQPALKLGLIEMTVPDKPNSRLQKYRLTEKGKDLKSEIM
jgi:predicted transcriptional regulator